MRKPLLVVCIATLPLTGCVTSSGDQTRLEGAGLGAVIGGGVGAAIGGRDGALLGAAIGGAAGAMFGDYVAKEKAKYASAEAMVAAHTQDVRQVTALAAAENETGRARIRIVNARIVELKKATGDKEQVRQALQKSASDLKQQRDKQAKLLTATKEQVKLEEAILKSLQEEAAKDATKNQTASDQAKVVEQAIATVTTQELMLAELDRTSTMVDQFYS